MLRDAKDTGEYYVEKVEKLMGMLRKFDEIIKYNSILKIENGEEKNVKIIEENVETAGLVIFNEIGYPTKCVYMLFSPEPKPKVNTAEVEQKSAANRKTPTLPKGNHLIS